MAKTAYIGVRVDEAVKVALTKAAVADQRPLSSMVEKIVVEWLGRKRVVVKRKGKR